MGGEGLEAKLKQFLLNMVDNEANETVDLKKKMVSGNSILSTIYYAYSRVVKVLDKFSVLKSISSFIVL